MTMRSDTVSEHNSIRQSNTTRCPLNLIEGRIAGNRKILELHHYIALHRLNSTHTDTFAQDYTSFLTNIEWADRENKIEREDKDIQEVQQVEYKVDMVNNTVDTVDTVDTADTADTADRKVRGLAGMKTETELIQKLVTTIEDNNSKILC
jgi:hypothetical protein